MPPEGQDDSVPLLRPVPLERRPGFVRSRVFRQGVKIPEKIWPEGFEFGDVFVGLGQVEGRVIIGPVDLPAEDHGSAHGAPKEIFLSVVVARPAAGEEELEAVSVTLVAVGLEIAVVSPP